MIEMMTDSHRIMRLICFRLMPTARRSPSSRVRSKIERPSVFTMPKSAIRMANARSAEIRPRS